MILHGNLVDVCAGPVLLLGLSGLGIYLCCVRRRGQFGLLISGLGVVVSAIACFALWADGYLLDEPVLCALAALALLANASALVFRLVMFQAERDIHPGD